VQTQLMVNMVAAYDKVYTIIQLNISLYNFQTTA